VNHRTVRRIVGLLLAIVLCTSAHIAPAGAASISNLAIEASNLSSGAGGVTYEMRFSLPGDLESGEALSAPEV
jgi:hypothetical protein